MNLTDAIALACEAHRGALDLGSKPYILHPLRVMLRMDNDDARMVAVLHDVIEDTDMTLADLRHRGCPMHVRDAVDALTHRPGEAYGAYIERVATCRLAREVKIADLEDNMDVTRLLLRELNERDLERLAKYHRAWLRLTSG
jgi:(p)ppGpp synthase/HD superfamily hydrolase